MNQLVTEHGLEKQLTRLEHCQEWGDDHEKKLEGLDTMWTTMLMTAEVSLQTSRSEDSFCEKLHKLKVEQHYWKKILKLTRRMDHYSLSQYFSGHEPKNIELPRIFFKETKKAWNSD